MKRFLFYIYLNINDFYYFKTLLDNDKSLINIIESNLKALNRSINYL